MNRSATAFAMVLAISLLFGGGDAEAEPELYDYVVKKGDTCVAIAKREFGDRKAYKLIHKYNRNLGSLPHRLKVGRVLRLPKRNVEPDAKLTDKRGSVRYRKPAAATWGPAKRGMELFKSWRVNSQKKASAELTFRDKSTIHMRENTVVIVYGPGAKKASRRTAVASLERGTLRARLSELNAKPVMVETPGSTAEITGGSALVSVDPKGTARVANHKGRAVKVRSRSKRNRKAVAVAVGMGSKVRKGEAPSKPKPLPPTPGWVKGTRTFASFDAGGGTIKGSWKPVKAAKKYRVEIAIDAVARAVVASVEVPASVTEFEASALPLGTYFVSVSSIDSDAFESIPSKRETIKLVAVEARGIVAPDGSIQVAVGSTIRASDGLECAAPESAASSTVVASKVGPLALACQNKKAPVSVPMVDVTPVTVASNIAMIPRGELTEVRMTLTSSGGPPPAVVLVAEPTGALVGQKQDGDVVVAQFKATQATAKAIGYRLVAKANPEVVVATGAFDVEKQAAAEPPPPVIAAPAEPGWGLRGFVALWQPSNAFGFEANGGGAVGVDGGFAVGLGLHRRLIGPLRLELEGSFARPDERGTESPRSVFGARAQGVITMFPRAKIASPFVAVGGGLLLSDGDDENLSLLGVHYGAGLSFRTTQSSRLRFEARHVISEAQTDGLASQLEAAIGGVILF